MEQSTVRYQNFIMDNARWDNFPFREGDIVITTPPKCGTTWTQMICGLLIFQTHEFPRPLDAMSVWVDMLNCPQEDLVAELESQNHRRFVKTHTPLDGLPLDDRATYVCVGRDPRDAAISWDNHWSNTDVEAVLELRRAALGDEAAMAGLPDGAMPEPPESPYDRFWAWVDNPDPQIGLPAMFHHMKTFWERRDQPNVVVMHYSEMKADLEGQMRRLAGRLGIEVKEDVWPSLVHHATFSTMKSRSNEVTPEAGIFKDPSLFFRKGTSGQWRELLDEADMRRYRDQAAELADPELIDWAHQGPIIG